MCETSSGTLRSSLVPLERLDRVDRLAGDEESEIDVMNLIRNQAHTKKHVSLNLDLDTDQGEGITQKLKYAAKQINDKIILHTSGASDEFSDIPTTSEYD